MGGVVFSAVEVARRLEKGRRRPPRLFRAGGSNHVPRVAPSPLHLSALRLLAFVRHCGVCHARVWGCGLGSLPAVGTSSRPVLAPHPFAQQSEPKTHDRAPGARPPPTRSPKKGCRPATCYTDTHTPPRASSPIFARPFRSGIPRPCCGGRVQCSARAARGRAARPRARRALRGTGGRCSIAGGVSGGARERRAGAARGGDSRPRRQRRWSRRATKRSTAARWARGIS